MRKSSVNYKGSLARSEGVPFISIDGNGSEAGDADSKLFGLSNHVWGVIFLLLGSLFNAVDSIMFAVANENGFSSNALTLYGSFCSLVGAIILDLLYYYKIGYNKGAVRWFVLRDIWRKEQREKLLSIPNYIYWFILFCISNYCNAFFLIISYAFADNVGDSIAIYDMYPVLIPLFGLCITRKALQETNKIKLSINISDDGNMNNDNDSNSDENMPDSSASASGHGHGFEWKNIYYICFVLSIIALLFLSKPGFVFGYHKDTNATDQIIAVFMALISAVFAALYVVSNTMIETLAQTSAQTTGSKVDSRKNMGNESNDDGDRMDNNGNKSDNDLNMIVVSDENTMDNNNEPGSKVEKKEDSPTRSSPKVSLNSHDSRNYQSTQKTDGQPSDVSISNSDGNKFIICNEMALVTVSIEYASIVTILFCFLFAPLGWVPDNIGGTDYSWFWGEFVLFKSDNFSSATSKGMWYAVGASVVWLFDYYFYTFGIFKLRNATLAGLLDVSDVLFGFILSYFWLNQGVDIYDVIGSVLIIIAIVVCIGEGNIVTCKRVFRRCVVLLWFH